MKKSYITYITALLLFGTNGIVASHIHLSSYNIVLLRTMLGSILLLAIFLLSGRRFSYFKHSKDCLYICLSGIAMGTSWMLLYEAYTQIGVCISSLLYYCGPVIVMALSPFLFREQLTVAKLIGFAAVLCGVFLVNGQSSDKLNTFGIVCGLLSAVMYSVMVMGNKKAEHITGMENSLIQIFISFLTVAVFVGIKNMGYAMEIASEDWPWILTLGLLNTGVGCYFFFSSIGKLPVQTVAVCGYLEPLSAVVFSVLLLGETMLPLQIVGAALIIGGALFGECVKLRK